MRDFNKVLVETARHIEAFEYYYALGNERNCTKVAEKYAVTRHTVENWYRNFHWKERVEIRDIEVSKGIQKDAKKANILARSKILADIDATLAIFRSSIGNTLKKLRDNSINFDNITSPKDFSELASALQKLIQLRLQVSGETKSDDDYDVVKIYLPKKNSNGHTELNKNTDE